jgi:hypothetical protein
MHQPLLPARSGDPSPWDEVLMAFLAEKLRRSGSRERSRATAGWAAKFAAGAGESIEAVSSFLDQSSLAVTTAYLRRLEGVEDRAWADVAAMIGV